MPATTPTWDPGQYLRHADHRARPFTDLLARVPDLPGDPPRIADLGCGPGNVTALLADRWPAARITGYDNSAEMLAADATAGPRRRRPARLRLRGPHALDARPETYDLIVSNAALQWVPGHLDAFPGLARRARPRRHPRLPGPRTTSTPPARPHARTRRDRPLEGPARRRAAPRGLRPRARRLPRPAGPPRLRRWTSGRRRTCNSWGGRIPCSTGSRAPACAPLLTALADDPEARDAFVDRVPDLLRKAYPTAPYGTVLPFRRLFAVARKGA